MAAKTKPKAFKLYPDEILYLEKMSQTLGMSQTDIVRLALKQMSITPRALKQTVNTMAETVAETRSGWEGDEW